jgi:nitrogenase molybdenum-iron protein alpha/beta subunit
VNEVNKTRFSAKSVVNQVFSTDLYENHVVYLQVGGKFHRAIRKTLSAHLELAHLR